MAYLGADASSFAKSSFFGAIFSIMASITKSLDLVDSSASVEYFILEVVSSINFSPAYTHTCAVSSQETQKGYMDQQGPPYHRDIPWHLRRTASLPPSAGYP